jgi:hypothetical protein
LKAEVRVLKKVELKAAKKAEVSAAVTVVSSVVWKVCN